MLHRNQFILSAEIDKLCLSLPFAVRKPSTCCTDYLSQSLPFFLCAGCSRRSCTCSRTFSCACFRLRRTERGWSATGSSPSRTETRSFASRIALVYLCIGVLPLPRLINWNVLMMIAGTMLLVHYFIDSKMPNLLADFLLKSSKNVMWVTDCMSLFAAVANKKYLYQVRSAS